jgi:hypothetical protein
VSRGTQVPSVPLSILDTGLSPSMARFSNLLAYLIMDHVMTVLQPHKPRGLMVWASSRSLAAT